MSGREAKILRTRDNLAQAQATQKYYADRNFREASYAVVDLVLLPSESLNYFNRNDLPAKLPTRYLGQLRVLRVMGPVTYQVELPPSMKKHTMCFTCRSVSHIGALCAEQGLFLF